MCLVQWISCAITGMYDNGTSFWNRSLQSCLRSVIPCIGCCLWTVYVRFICIHIWFPFFPICSDSTQVLDSKWQDIKSFHVKLWQWWGIPPQYTAFVSILNAMCGWRGLGWSVRCGCVCDCHETWIRTTLETRRCVLWRCRVATRPYITLLGIWSSRKSDPVGSM